MLGYEENCICNPVLDNSNESISSSQQEEPMYEALFSMFLVLMLHYKIDVFSVRRCPIFDVTDHPINPNYKSKSCSSKSMILDTRGHSNNT